MASFMFAAMMERICDFQRTFLELEGRCISYRDVVSETARLAHALQTLGVKPGDRVAVQVEKSPEALLLYLACVRAGSVFVPLNTAYTRKELEYFIGDAEPTLVVCRPEMVNAIQQVCSEFKVKACETLNDNAGGSLLQLAASQERVFRDVERGPEDIAAILYTSGTTGRSKGAMLTHQNLTSNALTLVDFWQFTEQDVLLHALPIFHTHGLFVATNVALFAGAKILLLRKFDAEAVLRLMPHATVMMGVPTFYTRLLQSRDLTPKACASMRLFISGSAPLPAETHREWRVRTGHAILERYGMTETNMNTSNPYEGERIAGTVGIPLPGVSLRVTDPESGSLLATDQVGMIEVKGPNVFKGYWRNPEKTKSEFRENGFFITGDLGKIDGRGYVQIVGRVKDLIITGGYNVYPKEVELEIDTLPGVLESAVIGLPHPAFGEGVTAVVVANGANPVTEEDILAALESRLARYKQPKRILLVPDLPRNATGKIEKNVLRQKYSELYRTIN